MQVIDFWLWLWLWLCFQHGRLGQFELQRRCIQLTFRLGQFNRQDRCRWRGRRCSDRQFRGGCATQARRHGDQRRRIRQASLAAFKANDPGREGAVFVGNHREQFRRHGEILLQPVIQGLLKGPCGFAEIRQTNHPATAFQGVGRAANDSERFDVARHFSQPRSLLADGAEHFVRFLKEDREQFGIDLGMAGFGQLQRCRRRLWGIGCRRLQAGQRGIDATAVQGFECCLGRLTQFAVSDKVGILLDGLQILFQLILQAGIFGRFAQGFDQVTRFAGLFG